MEETVKKQEPVTNQETVTSFPAKRKRSEAQKAWSKQLGQQSQTLKKQKKERLLQELQDRTSSQALHNQHDVATIEEIEEVKEQDNPDRTAIYFGLGLVAIIGCGVYCRYFRKPK